MCAQSGKLAFSFPASMGTARSGDSTRFSTTSSSYHIRPRSARLGVACSPSSFPRNMTSSITCRLWPTFPPLLPSPDLLTRPRLFEGNCVGLSSDKVFQYSSTRWSRYAAFWVCCSLIEPSSGRDVSCPWRRTHKSQRPPVRHDDRPIPVVGGTEEKCPDELATKTDPSPRLCSPVWSPIQSSRGSARMTTR